VNAADRQAGPRQHHSRQKGRNLEQGRWNESWGREGRPSSMARQPENEREMETQPEGREGTEWGKSAREGAQGGEGTVSREQKWKRVQSQS